MYGVNKRFKDDPATFLTSVGIIDARRHALAPPAMPAPPNPPVVEFDLTPHEKGVKLGRFASRHIDFPGHRPASFWSHTIKAYWLPWTSRRVAEVQLGNDADYFFTSQLAGCQIQIIPGPWRAGTNHPLVRHIAGDRTSGLDPTGTVWRNQQAALNIPPTHRPALQRRLTSTLPAGMLPGPNNYGRVEGVNVVGFISWMKWRFFWQQVDVETADLIRVFEIV